MYNVERRLNFSHLLEDRATNPYQTWPPPAKVSVGSTGGSVNLNIQLAVTPETNLSLI